MWKWLILVLLLSIGILVNPECSGEGVRTVLGCEDEYIKARLEMVQTQIFRRGVRNPMVLKAMEKVPRHFFVPGKLRDLSYSDRPLPIGHRQTISQPYIVAYMTEQLELKGGEKVLEIGTGSGYQAAVLAEIAKEVYSIEILCPLLENARAVLKELGYSNLTLKCDDGYKGWEEHAPFDSIIVTAAPDHIPSPLIRQLKVGGKMIIPVGESYQELLLITKSKSGEIVQRLLPVRFVPMTGKAQDWKSQPGAIK